MRQSADTSSIGPFWQEEAIVSRRVESLLKDQASLTARYLDGSCTNCPQKPRLDHHPGQEHNLKQCGLWRDGLFENFRAGKTFVHNITMLQKAMKLGFGKASI
jgi:hypothetical protein